MVHHAKVDWWLAALLGGLALVEFVLGVAALVAVLTTGSRDPTTVLATAAVLIGIGVLIGLALWGCYKTRYEVTPPDLIVRFGPFSSKVPLDAIVEVFPSRNPMSAPAPSLDRLRINYRRKNGKMWFALISPQDKEAFVRDLAGAAPQLHSAADQPLRLKAEEIASGRA
jgi:hypothetical protein